MATTLNDQIGRVLGGRYRLVAPVGAGASAQVFLADDTTLRRRVAVKMLHQGLASDETFLRRFRAEAQAAAAMNHPHIMAVYDWGEDDVPYLVGEYLGGGSLRGMLDAGHRLSVSQALLVGLEAARGLEYAHRQKIVHRDIKPANLLFDEEGRLRIADFGIARALAEAGWTEEGTVVGTVRYASPEQAKGDPLTGKSDIYALALVMIEAVTGEVPFVADTPISTLVARIDQQVPVPKELGPLQGILERAGRPDPDDRPDAGEFIIGLMAAAEQCERPDPLPLVGAIPKSGAEASAEEPTQVAIAPVVAPPAPVTPPTPPVEPTRVFERIERTPSPVPLAAEPTAVLVDEDDDADRPRRRWPWIVLGVVLLAAAITGGTIAYLMNRTISHEVPETRGWAVAELQALAVENDWELGNEQAIYDDEVPVGAVVRTLPPAGERLEEGGTLEYWVSLGPEPVPVPDLTGMSVEEAATALQAVELALSPEAPTEHHEEIPEGHVIRRLTEEDALIPGSEVQVVLSAGPEPRVLGDDLFGAPFDQVAAKLQEMRLEPVRQNAHHETVPEGAVIGFKTGDGAQDLPAGATVPRDSQVQVIVSQGPAPRPVPNVLGRSLDEATDILESEGFEVLVSGNPRTRVFATNPPAGTVRPKGSTVEVYMTIR